MISKALVLASLALSLPAVHAVDKPYTLTLTNKQIAPDGVSTVAIAVNNQMPGPLLTANKGDVFKIKVQNNLANSSLWRSSSVHWHGLHVLNHNWADGASSVTQCPIVPGELFDYTVPTNEQYGTFWYHSHFSSQYCEGLRGPMIVYHPNDPHKALYDVDDASTIISLNDWFHEPMKPYRPEVWHAPPPEPQSTLFNGLGIAHNTNGLKGSHAVISVTKGKRYRFRIIQMACDPNYIFSIDGHAMTVIEADSVETKPLVVDSFQVFPGQRYSIVVNANQTIGNYWIRALPNRALQTNFNYNANVAILRYVGAPVTTPSTPANTSIPVSTKPLVESQLQPLVNLPVPGTPQLGKADINITLTTVLDESTFMYKMNGVTFHGSAVPVLLQIMNGQNFGSLLPAGSLYNLPRNKTIELTILGSGDGGAPHPFHLHGHDFWVVKSADSNTPKWTNAIQRDTVNAGAASTSAVIRFRTDNPGPWFLHCHIDFHLDMGLGVVFVEDMENTESAQGLTETDPWMNLCPTYNAWKQAGNED